ncbi:hypothetical protein M2317_001180 [Microbacterium sp. ZKA21]|uniref:hypothetical protein n=1 Tax=Microbacterium sp. ZKA21 TaxID=3381694 RepID=UPI003D19D6F7
MRVRRSLAASAAVLLTAVLLVAAPGAAQAGVAESDSFDGWTTTVSGAPEFVVSADGESVHEGAASARIAYDSAYSNSYVDLRQSIRANGGTTYDMSAWVRTEELSSSDSAYFVLSGDHSQRVELPEGTSDWTKLEWTYTQPAGSMTFVMRLLIRGTGTIWVDDVRMVARGADTDLVINGSFEEHDPPPGTLAFSDTVLVYTAGEAAVGVSTLGAEIDWEVRAASGQRVDSGRETTSTGEASIDLSALPVGYYRIRMSIDAPVAAVREASLAIIAEAQASGESPIGMAVHVNRYTVDQVDALMGPLGAGALREGPAWDTIETSPGVYEFPELFDAQVAAAKARGERPLVILAYFSRWYDEGKTPSSPEGIQAFADYAAAAAGHYGSDVDYEVFNEFNHSFNTGACGMTAACYEQLLEPAAAAIHAAAPGARVVGPVLAGADWTFFEELFALGALEYLDVVSYHTYDFPVAPEGKTEAGVARLRALVDQYAPDGSDIPIWLTEHGWPTTMGGTTEQEQAAYYLRSAALLEAAGVEKVIFYELIDSGVNPAEQEHNFGIARRPVDGGTALSPKPAFPALVAFNRLTAGLDLVGVESPGDVRVATYAGATASETVRMLWAPSGHGVVHTDIGASARVVDTDGRERRVRPGGPLELVLSGDPVFVVGDTAAPEPVQEAAVTISTPPEIAAGSGADVPVTVRGADLALSGNVTVAGPVGAAEALAATGNAYSGTLALAALRDVGSMPLTYTVRQGDGIVAFVDATTEVVTNPVLSFGPVASGGAVEQVLEVRNLAEDEASLGEISWRVGEEQGVLDDAAVPAGGNLSLPIVSDVSDWSPVPFSISTVADGVQRTLDGTTVSAPIPARADEAVDVSMAEHGDYVAIAGTQPDAVDLDAGFALSWSPEGLRIRVDVVDDEHVAAATIDRLWSGDCVQFAVAAGSPGSAPASRVEFGAYLGADGPGVYRYTSPVGADAAVTATIERDGTTTRYDLLAPWSELGIDPADGAFSFSLLVGDNDAGVRQGFYEWGSGIGASKNAAMFLPVVPMPAPAAASSILVDGHEIDGFDPSVTDYEIGALAGGPLPTITATAPEGVHVDVVQATAAPGQAVVTVEAEGRPTTTYTITVRRVVGDDASAEASATAVCIDGTARLAVRIRNTAVFASDVRATTTFDDRTQKGLEAGATAELVLDTGAAFVDAGDVRIAAYAPYAAPDRAASYLEFRVASPAVDCTTSHP